MVMIDNTTESDVDLNRRIDTAFINGHRLRAQTRIRTHISSSDKRERRFVIDISRPVFDLKRVLPAGSDILLHSPKDIIRVKQQIRRAHQSMENMRFEVYDAYTHKRVGCMTIEQFIFKYGDQRPWDEQIRAEMKEMDSFQEGENNGHD